MVLTDSKVKQAKFKAKDYKLSDGKGLFLLVTKAGAKYWRLKYRFLGKEKLLSLVYPNVTLKQARKATITAKEQIDQGIDPSSQAKKAKKAERVQAQTNNLHFIAIEWHTQQSKQWSEGLPPKYCVQWSVIYFRM